MNAHHKPSEDKVDKRAEHNKKQEIICNVNNNEIKRKADQGRVYSLSEWGPAES